jgi:hypothetical protein
MMSSDIAHLVKRDHKKELSELIPLGNDVMSCRRATKKCAEHRLNDILGVDSGS